MPTTKASQSRRRSGASRNAARATMVKAGKATKGDGKDVAHKNGNAKDNRKSNLTVQSKSKNRSYARTKTARKKDPKS